MLELHRVRGTALRHRAQGRRVAEHFRQRDFGLDDLATAEHVVHALHHATTAGQIAHHVAGVVFRRFDFHGHHRLQDHRAGLAAAVLKAHRRRHLERVFVRVDLVVRAEGQGDLHIDHREAGQHAVRQSFFDALLDRRNEFLGHNTALGRVDKFEALAWILRFDRQDDMAILALAARLAHELAIDVSGRLANGFAVGHLRLADVGFHAELALHPVDDDFQVQLAHAGNDGLTRFFIGAQTERWVFLGQTAQGDTHFFLVGLGLWLDSLRNHRLRKHHLFQGDDRARIAQGLARGDVFQTHAGSDIAGQNFRNFFALVGVHLQDSSNPLFLAANRVVHRVARLQHARRYAHRNRSKTHRLWCVHRPRWR